jgi:hypothetical protein
MSTYIVHAYQRVRRTIAIEADSPREAALEAIETLEADETAGRYHDCEEAIDELTVDEATGKLDVLSLNNRGDTPIGRNDSGEPIVPGCTVCADMRYLIASRDDGFLAIERCDECSWHGDNDSHTLSDEDAAKLARANGHEVADGYPAYLLNNGERIVATLTR